MDLDDTQEKVLNIALNKISGVWDEEQLAMSWLNYKSMSWIL
ncbi:hypothetical protein [Brevibacillus reuszeri]|nr:hypothetical protein [Brevibacillus reuszeri]